MCRLLISLFVLSASVVTVGQTRERIDLSSLGFGAIEVPQAIDTDGWPFTQEWLIASTDQPWLRRVVAERSPGLCIGPWFSLADAENETRWVLMTRYGLSVLVRLSDRNLDIVSLDTPTCAGPPPPPPWE